MICVKETPSATEQSLDYFTALHPGNQQSYLQQQKFFMQYAAKLDTIICAQRALILYIIGLTTCARQLSCKQLC